MSPVAIIALLLVLMALCMGGIVWFVLWLSDKAFKQANKGL